MGEIGNNAAGADDANGAKIDRDRTQSFGSLYRSRRAAPRYNRPMAGPSARTPPKAHSVANALLGGLPVARFLRRFWQKEALLVRGAVADFRDPLTAAELFALARRDDVESRLVVRTGARWS